MRSTQLIDNLNNAVRENPVAAGLIGLGLAWIVLGQSGPAVRQSDMARSAKRAIDATVDTASNAAREALNQAQTAASGIQDAVSQGVEAASTKIDDAVEGLKTSHHEPKYQSELQRHFPSPPSSRLADLLDRQPLALAGVGLAVGAALAAAFPATDVESRIMGSTGEKLKETVASTTDRIVDRAGAAIDEAVDEAVAQDLTPEAVKEAVRAGAEKLKTVADAGLDSMRK
ncbi:hypothetical protein [Taklimakanibacter deserti]|uniref:hypothetical protein n=1 Tax=Taklimakanibacter deserti TaxID=2267839 RepID=UPI000E64D9FD